MSKITLSQDFIEQATSRDVAEAVVAAEQAKANDAIWLFGSRINPPFRRRR